MDEFFCSSAATGRIPVGSVGGFLVDLKGAVAVTQEVDAGMQIINVSVLQKGNYILKATDKSTNTVISEQLVKNNLRFPGN